MLLSIVVFIDALILWLLFKVTTQGEFSYNPLLLTIMVFIDALILWLLFKVTTQGEFSYNPLLLSIMVVIRFLIPWLDMVRDCAKCPVSNRWIQRHTLKRQK
jgi:hypothetical protein